MFKLGNKGYKGRDEGTRKLEWQERKLWRGDRGMRVGVGEFENQRCTRHYTREGMIIKGAHNADAHRSYRCTIGPPAKSESSQKPKATPRERPQNPNEAKKPNTPAKRRKGRPGTRARQTSAALQRRPSQGSFGSIFFLSQSSGHAAHFAEKEDNRQQQHEGTRTRELRYDFLTR
ncbi:hypothetical protein BV20DRAFT_699730 [Pilatotrama ljubarskyi]|nr:hypothetical protein BV20DRAFT_699730 [Pilatotrama ljubarskyi]